MKHFTHKQDRDIYDIYSIFGNIVTGVESCGGSRSCRQEDLDFCKGNNVMGFCCGYRFHEWVVWKE